MDQRVALIHRPYVPIHDGELVYLEQNPAMGTGRYSGLAKITGLYKTNYALYRINWNGIGESGSLSMSSYGRDWRLWTVRVESPVAYERNKTPWVKEKPA